MIADLVRYKRYEPLRTRRRSDRGAAQPRPLQAIARGALHSLEEQGDGHPSIGRSPSLQACSATRTVRPTASCCSTAPRPTRCSEPSVGTLERIPQGGFAREVRASQGREAQSACQGIRGRRVRLQDARRLRGEAFDGGARLRAGPGQGGRKGSWPACWSGRRASGSSPSPA